MYFRYKQKNYKTWLHELGIILGIPVTNNLLQFPHDLGKGYCLADSINKSISFVIIDAVINEKLILDRMNNNQTGIVIFFNQTQTNNTIRISTKNEVLTDYFIKEQKNIFISSSNTDLQIAFKGGSALKRLGVYLSPQWIDENLDCLVKKQFLLLAKENLQLVNQLLINDELQKQLTCIFQNYSITDQSKTELKNNVISLVETFFTSYFKMPFKMLKKQEIPQDDIVRLQEIESILKNDEIDKFPSILNLAKIAHMSGTKLKLRFKQVYGYRLYEFYNKQRMEKAKFLIENGLTSKEAAYSIGFNDVSNFTKAFKREYGYTPGRIFDKPTS